MPGLATVGGMHDRPPRWAWTHKYAVPMFISSLIAVVLAGSGLLAVTVFANGGDGDGGEDESGIDPCVIDTWRTVSYEEDGELGSAEMVDGEPTFTFDENGTGLADFGTGMRMEADVFGTDQEAWVLGQITYHYQTSGQTLEFVDQDSAAPFSPPPPIDIPGLDDELTLPTGPLDYTCDDDEMTIAGEEQAFEYERAAS